MIIRVSKFGTVSSAIVAALLAASGCGGDKKTDTLGEGGATANLGGETSTGGTATGTGGTTSSNGGATSVGGTSTTAVAGAAPFACGKGTPTAPEIAPGTNGVWGTSSPLAGGTFAYQDDSNVVTPKFTVDTATTPGSVMLASNIPVGGYAGFGIYFKDPEKCWDASSYTGGIRVTLSGDLGGADLLFQVQTNNNYPIDKANKKGACTGTWTDGCGNSQFKVPATAVTATPAALDIPWASLAGGSPIATIENSEILGIQWQVNCSGANPCATSLVIGAVTFY